MRRHVLCAQYSGASSTNVTSNVQVRPGRATADYITKTLNRMSILGSAFLGALAAAPPLVEAVTGLQVRPFTTWSTAWLTTLPCPAFETHTQWHCLHCTNGSAWLATWRH